jgi:site-specific DNA-methyltransferase (adenine-specific)
MISEVKNMDCMEYMSQFSDNYFELAIVDPPYGISEDGSKNHTRSKLAIAKNYKSFSGFDKEPESYEYFIELKRVSKNQIIWGANHFIQNIPRSNSSCWIVWDKINGNSDFADCELAYTSFKSAVRKFQYRWNGMFQQDMKNKEFRIHPTQKPVALYRWLLQNYAKPNHKILDTHLGSGSSRIAADMEGFDFYACELDKDYFDMSCKRFEDYKKQLKLL